MDPQAPTSYSDDSDSSLTPPRDDVDMPPRPMRPSLRMYALQVRAFIEAIEVVDADPDTIEDILDGFDEELLAEEEEEILRGSGITHEHGHSAHAESEGQLTPEEQELIDQREDEEFERYLEEGNTKFGDELCGPGHS